MRRHGFPEPELQFELRDAAGRVIARTDAALVDWKILLEYDSDQEHVDVVDLAKDTRRRLWAARYGYWMLSVRAADLRDGGQILAAALRGLIAERTNPTNPTGRPSQPASPARVRHD